MQNPAGPYGGPYSGAYPREPPPHPRRWLYIGVAVMLVLIGVAVLLILLTPATFGYSPSAGYRFGPFGLLGGFFLVFILLFIVLWIVRIAMWSSRPGRYNRGYYGGGGGRRYGAIAIARERYARGEITREQYDQLLQDLERRPGYPPPR